MFYEIINQIKNGYHHNFKYKKIKFNKKDKILIDFFLRLGVISKVYLKKNLFYMKYTYSNQNKKTVLIQNYYKPSRKVFIKLKILKKLTLKKNMIFLISTNKGLMTNFEAVKKGLGGLIILKI